MVAILKAQAYHFNHSPSDSATYRQICSYVNLSQNLLASGQTMSM
jgi:hypothetical protein